MFIYRITNTINNKKYIGSTKHPEIRKKQHFYYSTLVTHPTYNYPLQCAIRKYGKENFLFEILEEVTQDECASIEYQWIIKENSLTNTGWGYNQTIDTNTALKDPIVIAKNIERTGIRCAEIDYNNNIVNIYNSYHEAARSIGSNEASIIRRVCDGKAFSIHNKIFRRIDKNNIVEIPLSIPRKRKTAIVGVSIFDPNDIVYYESISEAARIENIERSSLSKCINGSTKYSKVKNRKWEKVGDY